MAHCDLFWLTSLFEGFGVVLVEALSVGASILSVDCPHGPREILAEGRYGRLVSSFDVEENARELLEVIDSPRPDPALHKLRALDFERCVRPGISRFWVTRNKLYRVWTSDPRSYSTCVYRFGDCARDGTLSLAEVVFKGHLQFESTPKRQSWIHPH